ncbi:MAG: hypothetical protein M3320_00285 [Actinomycetota bacterium]|nr:hypothetical protein [Actinomycetota bacterium]MDQ5807094.1 hypothetical protein [Actinomycetota bacterium]
MSAAGLLLRVLIVALVAAAVGAGAYALSERQEKRYAATTRLLFGPPPAELRAIGLSQESDEEERSLANRVQEVRSYDIAVRTAEALADPTWDADSIASAISVRTDRTADVVTVSAESEDAERSAELLSEYRRQYILDQQELVKARAEAARKALRSALQELPRRSRFGVRGDVLRTQIGALRVLERTGGEPVIIEGIRAFADPVTPKTTRNTLFGLLFGAVLGVGLVSLRAATRPRRDPEPAAETSR